MTFDRNGLTVKNADEFNTDIQNEQIGSIETAFSYRDDSLIYQLNSVYAKSSAEISQLLEVVYDSIQLGKAEGVFLDQLALLRGVTRLEELASFTNVQYANMAPTASLPAGSIFSSSTLQAKATNSSTITPNSSNSYETQYLLTSAIDNEAVGSTFSIIVNTTTYSYTTVLNDTVAEVLSGITAQIDLDTAKTFTYTTGTSGTGSLLTITPNSGTILSSQSLNTLIQTVYIKTYFTATLTETGAIEVLEGEMDTLDSSVIGIFEVGNDQDYVQGRSEETDEELRPRIAAGPIGDCTGTVDSIQASLLANVPGVSVATVRENRTDFPNDGVAVGSFFPDGTPFGGYEVLVVGGVDQDIAEEIWRTKPAGTPIVGNLQLTVLDSNQNNRFVYFSRPTEIHIAIEVDYTTYPEEIFPVGGEQAIQDAVVAHTNALPLDEDVIVGRIRCAIRKAVPDGIDELTVRIQTIAMPGDTPAPGSWQTTRLAISGSEFATTTAQDITITNVTV